MKYLLRVLVVALFASIAWANAEDGSKWRCALIELDKVEVQYQERKDKPGKYEYRIVVHHDKTIQYGEWVYGAEVEYNKVTKTTGVRWAPKAIGPDGNRFRIRYGRLSYEATNEAGQNIWYGSTKLAPNKGQAL